MNVKELREKSVDQLNEQLLDGLKTRFEYRMQSSTGQLNQTHLVKQVRRDIARIKTVLREKQDK